MRASKLAIVIALLLAGVGIARAALPGPAGSAAARGGSAGALRVAGSVEGLYPGATVPFRVRIENRRPQPVLLRSVRVRVGSAAAGCDRRLLRVPAARPRVRIRPGAARRVRLRATLSPEAVDACQGASFPLRFRARAVVAR
jgi:hypothetical protein